MARRHTDKRVVVCGAGQVGTHAAEVLVAAGHHVTMIDASAQKLAGIEDRMDLATLRGNCANADVLTKAMGESGDILIAATNSDEINLLCAAVGKALGIKQVIARVHHSAYFEQRGMDYARQFNIDTLICPEYSTATAIAATLRNPGALAIESFARGRIELQEFHITVKSPANNRSLIDLKLPQGMRIALVTRHGEPFIPDASTVMQESDIAVAVGNTDVFDKGARLLSAETRKRQRVAIMGGSGMTVWLCRALQQRGWSVRVFEEDRQRAEELAEKLEWITVLQADPTDAAVWEEEGLVDIDAFVALAQDDDERNILSCAWAKSMGAKLAIAVVSRAGYSHLLKPIGIDYIFTPRMLAAREIIGAIDTSCLQSLATLAEGVINVYRGRVMAGAPVAGKALRDLGLKPDWIVAAMQHDDQVFVPTADDVLNAGDTALLVGRRGTSEPLEKMFCG